jgi:hypothetical protein
MWQELSGRDKFRAGAAIFGMALGVFLAVLFAVMGYPFHAATSLFITANFAFGLYAKVIKPASKERQPRTFRAVAQECIEGRKRRVFADYESLMDNLILPRWGDTALKDITHAELQRWISGLSASESEAAVIQVHQCMSEVLKYAIDTDRLTRNVAVGIELPA